MRIITVIPIGRGMSKETLTYFTREDVVHGSIVSIPIRSKMGLGLVVKSESVSQNKSEIKSLTYSMKKIDTVKSHSFLSPDFILSVGKIADYYATTHGAVLSALLPKIILDSSNECAYTPHSKPVGIVNETLLVQSDDEERFATYKSLIREEFAKGRSVFMCVATTEGLQNAKEIIHKGIENYTFVLHAGLTKKTLVALWQKITNETHPVLVIGSGTFLSLPRDDFGTIIIEKESSRSFIQPSRPYIDIRTAALIIAKTSGIRLIYGDSLLRIETVWEEKTGSAIALSPLKFRSLSKAVCELVDMKTPQDLEKKEFEIIGSKLKDMILATFKNNEHTFIFCGRKGLSPTTVCSDCGTVVSCINCGAPVVLYGTAAQNERLHDSDKQSRVYVCHQCGTRRPADTHCAYCNGWRLTTLGIGIENVVEKIEGLMPEKKLFIMDKDHIATHSKAVQTRNEFYNTPGSIMVGTEMALPYLNQKIDNTAVVSLDSFFSIPDFRIHEKIFHILLDIRNVTEKHMLVQTRQKNTTIFDNALKGNLIDFYRDEIEERKQVNFPPFTTAIKITIRAEKKIATEMMKEIVDLISPIEISVFESFLSSEQKQMFILHGVIMLPRGEWPHMKLIQKLRSLPPSISIKIDPDTLL